MNNSATDKSLLEFPCKFPIKVIGEDSPQLKDQVLAIIKAQVTNLDELSIRTSPSKNGKYIAITVTIVAESQAQLDNIYQAVNKLPQVKMTL